MQRVLLFTDDVAVATNAQQVGQLWNATCAICIFIINWFIKCHKVIASESPFVPRDGRKHLRYSLHLPMEGWPGWVAWINTAMVDPPKVVTNPITNRARRSVMSLMWQTPLPLRQTSYNVWQCLNIADICVCHFAALLRAVFVACCRF